MSSPTAQELRFDLPECVAALAENHRYYVLYGGRNGVKTWSVARHLLSWGIRESIRVLCCRETMNKIEESVHTCLSDQIKMLNLEAYYDVQKTAIYGKKKRMIRDSFTRAFADYRMIKRP